MCEIDFTHPSYFVYSILHVSLSCKIDFGKYQEPNQLHPQLPLQLSYISNNTNCHTNCHTNSLRICIAKINTNSHPNCDTKGNANIIANNNAYIQTQWKQTVMATDTPTDNRTNLIIMS